MKQHVIGVFDSGVGGLSVAQAIEETLKDVTVIFANDPEHVPYGSKTSQEVLSYAVPIMKKLEKDGCELIVIACNTVTTTLLPELKKEISIPLIGLEPMVKTAAERTQTGIIAVCATPATLGSQRYEYLKDTYAKHISIIEPDCSTWSTMIETSKIDHDFIARQINEVCDQRADVIVLGCTHYHWIEEDIKTIAAGRALIMQPEQSVVRKVVRVLEELDQS
jgi:glutamate racemase